MLPQKQFIYKQIISVLLKEIGKRNQIMLQATAANFAHTKHKKETETTFSGKLRW